MFTKTLAIAALALAAAASALAGEVTPDHSQIPNSTLTRAEVIAEYVRAKQAGEVTPEPPYTHSSTLSRAEVQQATHTHLRAVGHQGGDRTVIAEPMGLSKTRAQVVAETLEAIRLGVVDRGERSTVVTAAQLESIRRAGLTALPMDVAMR